MSFISEIQMVVPWEDIAKIKDVIGVEIIANRDDLRCFQPHYTMHFHSSFFFQSLNVCMCTEILPV